jgi:hypothetical protein
MDGRVRICIVDISYHQFFFNLASRRIEHSICFCITRNGVSNSQNEKERGGVNITSI